MNKKKIIAGASALALVACLGIGGSLAWFTDTEERVNTVTLNHVDMTLEEVFTEGQTVMPGATIDKRPFVTLSNDSSRAYVRIKGITANLTAADGSVSVLTADDLQIQINTPNWVLGTDGYYYYQNIVEAGQSTSSVFDTITIPGSLTNEVANSTIDILVDAEAIQADNYTPTTNEEGQIVGWANSGEITEYVDLSTGN